MPRPTFSGVSSLPMRFLVGGRGFMAFGIDAFWVLPNKPHIPCVTKFAAPRNGQSTTKTHVEDWGDADNTTVSLSRG